MKHAWWFSSLFVPRANLTLVLMLGTAARTPIPLVSKVEILGDILGEERKCGRSNVRTGMSGC